MSNQTANKFSSIRVALEKEIRWGRYKPKQRLPAEKQIAAQFGVSYMTARRAVTELVEANLLVRHVGSGVYVSDNVPSSLTPQTVNIVCQFDDNTLTRSFLRIAARQCEEAGWNPDIIRYGERTHEETLEALRRSEPALVLADNTDIHGALGDAMHGSDGQVVVIGNRLDQFGVSSVLADDAQGIRLAVDHLIEHGHRRIAVVADNSETYIGSIRVRAWEQSMQEHGLEAAPALRIAVTIPPHVCCVETGYAAVRRYLHESTTNRPTALIGFNDELSLGTMAACRDEGLACPDKISIVCGCDSPQMAYGYPAVTCVDTDIEAHVQQALEMIRLRIAGQLAPDDRLRLVAPRLIVRESVGSPSD
ncbi:MAG: LacI family DNA-binding transcriptional regulator [Capsulimonadaceae bacterium]|nr:LacI family DNA-binding transcriptional regulator [Capsulimonadaceae bacterium]